MTVEKLYVGGWFQRTTLHLSEIYDFLKDAESPLGLDQATIRKHRSKLNIETLKLEVENLEYIELTTSDRITVKIFEDGLITLQKDHDHELQEDIMTLTDYYEDRLSPGISYIFSLGAPVPKELANIKTIYPYFVVLKNAKPAEITELMEDFKQEKHFEVKNPGFQIVRGDKLYIINNKKEKIADIEAFIQEQIFIREFKGQMHRYLNLHRIIWEKIADVKERGEIRGSEVGEFYDKIESYSKTINLIDGRINQMGAYVHTREAMVKNSKSLTKFMNVLEFKYETLTDTQKYIKDIWSMTKNYVSSARELFGEIQAKSTEKSVENLTIVTSMGVGAGLIELFSATHAPEFTGFGVLYFFILAAIGYITSRVMKYLSKRKMYEISDVELAKDIK